MRVERIGDATLYLGDCYEHLPELALADAIVTDPPYGMKYKPKARKSLKFQVPKEKIDRRWPRIVGDDIAFDPRPFALGAEQIFFGADHFANRLPSGGSWIIWDKKCGVYQDWSGADCEIVWHSKPGAPRLYRQMWMGTGRAGHRAPAERYQPQSNHPTEKPVQFMRYLIERTGARVVADPFMGAGATGVACAQLGLRFIGVEMERAYFETACRRIAEAYAQPALFPPPPRPVQTKMELGDGR